MERNYIIALVLMTVVIAIWMLAVIPRSRRDYSQNGTDQVKQEEKSESQVGEKKISMAKKDTAKDVVGEAEDDDSRFRQMIDSGKKVVIDTDYYNVEFSERKAIAKSWKLKEFNRRDNGDELFDLIPSSAQNCLAIKFIDGGLQLDAMDSSWEADKSEVILDDDSESESVTFRSQIGDNLELLKKFTFYNNSYVVDLDISFHNKSNNKLTALFAKDESGDSGYMLRWGPGMPADNLPGGKSQKKRGGHNGAKVCTIENKVKNRLKEEEERMPVKWVAFENQYFVASMIPEPGLEPEYRRETLGDVKTAGEEGIVAETEAASLMIPGFSLGPGKTKTNHFRLYVGPKNNGLLKKVNLPVSEEPAKLNKVINFGIFGFLSVIMLWLINIFHKVTANYGVAIILLTIFVKVVLYPLTRKSYKSMKKMKELQPLMTELQEKYRDNPQKLNKAVMRLYKEQGVNPMGGCIPFLPQMPILFALFSAIRNSIELRGAGFVPYIASDLSAPSDALFDIPTGFTIPMIGAAGVLPIRILPLIYMGATFLQQKVTGIGAATGTGSQNKMMKYLPIMFGLIFYNFESGLVLYWLCNLIFTTLEQYIINKKSNNDKEVKPKKGK